MEPKISDKNQICIKKSYEYCKIQLFLREKSDESFLEVFLLSLHPAYIENIPEFVIPLRLICLVQVKITDVYSISSVLFKNQ